MCSAPRGHALKTTSAKQVPPLGWLETGARALRLDVAPAGGATEHPPHPTPPPLYLSIVANLLGDQLIEDGAVVLVDLLHLVDVAGDLLHGLQGLCRDQKEGEGGDGGRGKTRSQRVLLAHL